MKHVVLALGVAIGLALAVAQQQITANVFAQTSLPRPDLELRLRANELRNGLPQSFTFVVVNSSDHPVLIPPQPSSCFGLNGTMRLAVTFTSLKGEVKGGGGGCGSGEEGTRPRILDRVKSWKRLEPGESLSVPYSNNDSTGFQKASGVYEFWGEYDPPELTSEDIATLKRAGIDFPRQKLTSNHLRFNTATGAEPHE